MTNREQAQVSRRAPGLHRYGCPLRAPASKQRQRTDPIVAEHELEIILAFRIDAQLADGVVRDAAHAQHAPTRQWNRTPVRRAVWPNALTARDP